MTSMTSTTRQDHHLYIALFARTAVPRTYHWALLICGSASNHATATGGARHHVTNSIQTRTPTVDISSRILWRYEVQDMASLFTANPLLARVRISRISDIGSVSSALEAVPLIQDDSNWTCRVWVRDAIGTLARAGLIEVPCDIPRPVVVVEDGRVSMGEMAWDVIEQACRSYLDAKHEIGRWRVNPGGRWVEGQVPTWDLVEGKEIVA